MTFYDAVSNAKGDPNYCGAKTYTISPSNLSALTLADGTLSLSSSSNDDVTSSPVTVTLTVTLESFPDITLSKTLTVTIQGQCILTFDTTPSEQTINVGVSAKTVSVPFTVIKN